MGDEPMQGYGKMAQTAIATVTALAESYGGGGVMSSAGVAAARNLPKPLVAKVLTQLSRVGLVEGAPGPGGGYRLSVEPSELTLHAVVASFERIGEPLMCPLGPGWCGTANPCPLHDQIAAMAGSLERFLHENHFGMFAGGDSARRSTTATAMTS
ncbi:hypothetical protein BH23VER1_BH23VER1_05200 [soil metagenome]